MTLRRIFSPALFYNLTLCPVDKYFSLCKQRILYFGCVRFEVSCIDLLDSLSSKGPGCVCLHFCTSCYFSVFNANKSTPERSLLRDFSESQAVNLEYSFLENCQQLWFGSCNLLYVNVQNIYGKSRCADPDYSKKCFRRISSFIFSHVRVVIVCSWTSSTAEWFLF